MLKQAGEAKPAKGYQECRRSRRQPNNDMHRSAGSKSLIVVPMPLPAPGDVRRWVSPIAFLEIVNE